MLSNYFKIAWRNLVKQKQFTLLNLLGLSTGLACTLMIYLWVQDERQVDKFNDKDARIFQVLKTVPNSDGTFSSYETTQGLLAQEFVKVYPEVEKAVSVRKEDQLGILSMEDKHLKASWEFADKDYFNIFSYTLVEGNQHNPIPDKNSVLVSEKLALKLYPRIKDVIGKRFDWKTGGEFDGTYTITGIFQSPPANATSQFDMIFDYAQYVEKEIGGMGDVSNWGSNSVMTFLLLKPGIDPIAFNRKIKDFTKAKIKSLGGSEEALKYEGDIFMQKYSDRYLHNHYENGKIAGGRIEYVRLFSVIAIFILVIACINFMNLSTARAASRMKEVGIRKVVGATRNSLIFQYLGESLLMSFLSIAVALLLTSLLLPVFREITGKNLSINMSPGFLGSIVSIAVITGFIAGSYPALYLSGFKPIKVLKGKLSVSSGESAIRKGLVIFQFATSVILIIAVMVVYQQMKLVQTKNLGYNKDNIIRFSNEGKLKDHLESFLQEIKKIPGVSEASAMNGDFLGNASHSGGGISWEGKDPNLGIEYFGVSGDYGFLELLGVKMAEGRFFSRQFGSDSSSVIFNEAAIAAMGLKNPVGKMVSLWGNKKQIVGVVKDFHFQSLYNKVGPAFMEYFQQNDMVLVKIKSGTEQQTISKLAAFYKSFNEGLPFEFKFMDDDYQAMYSSEQKVGVLSRYFAVIAIIISCLGLFGLSAFTAQKRQKEIGIRKVIGASVNNIAMMLSKEFLKLVVLAVVIAFPLAWWACNSWLQGFAYRVTLGPSVFLIAGLSIIVITLLTVSFQAIRAALANPVKSLRAE